MGNIFQTTCVSMSPSTEAAHLVDELDVVEVALLGVDQLLHQLASLVQLNYMVFVFFPHNSCNLSLASNWLLFILQKMVFSQ